MDDDEAFVQAIRNDPENDALRLIYADWLEERNDTRGDFLRTLVFFRQLPLGHPRRPLLSMRLRKLRPDNDAWLAAVEQAPVENCRATFIIECNQQWENLAPTESPTIRHCAVCRQQVHFCLSMADAQQHAQLGECVAVESSLVRHPSDLSSPGETRFQMVLLGKIASESAIPPLPVMEELESGRGRRRGRKRQRKTKRG